MFNKIKDFLDRKKYLVIFLMGIPFFNDGYSFINDYVMDHFKTIVLLCFIGLYVFNKKKPSKLLWILIGIELWWLVCTLVNYPISENIVYHKQLVDMINAVCVGMIVDYFRDDYKQLVKGLMLNFELCIYPNLLLSFTDIYEPVYYLLGYYSLLILWILPAVCIALLYIYLNKKYVRGFILIAACYFTTILVWNATTIVALAGLSFVLLFGFLLRETNRKTKILLSVMLIMSLLLNLFVLFAYSGGNYPLVDFIIEKILRKSTTFTGRTYIWGEALQMIKEKPIFGYGFRPEIVVNENAVFIHAHNMLLQRLTATGIPGLILFIWLHIELIREVDKGRNSLARLYMVAGVFAVSLTYITDAYKKFFRLYLILFLAYHVCEGIKKYKKS